jgi:hypothetical protein
MFSYVRLGLGLWQSCLVSGNIAQGMKVIKAPNPHPCVYLVTGMVTMGVFGILSPFWTHRGQVRFPLVHLKRAWGKILVTDLVPRDAWIATQEPLCLVARMF